jgi:hypothetical protein
MTVLGGSGVVPRTGQSLGNITFFAGPFKLSFNLTMTEGWHPSWNEFFVMKTAAREMTALYLSPDNHFVATVAQAGGARPACGGTIAPKVGVQYLIEITASCDGNKTVLSIAVDNDVSGLGASCTFPGALVSEDSSVTVLANEAGIVAPPAELGPIYYMPNPTGADGARVVVVAPTAAPVTPPTPPADRGTVVVIGTSNFVPRGQVLGDLIFLAGSFKLAFDLTFTDDYVSTWNQFFVVKTTSQYREMTGFYLSPDNLFHATVAQAGGARPACAGTIAPVVGVLYHIEITASCDGSKTVLSIAVDNDVSGLGASCTFPGVLESRDFEAFVLANEGLGSPPAELSKITYFPSLSLGPVLLSLSDGARALPHFVWAFCAGILAALLA